MAGPSQRKLARSDYFLVQRLLTDMVKRLRAKGRKAIYEYMDADTALKHLYAMEHVYIVDEAYLIAYDLCTPWYVRQDLTFLEEVLVMGLAVSGDFTVVPAFIERKAREAGAVLAVAGTALATSDDALASLYHRAGYSTQAITLIKEP